MNVLSRFIALAIVCSSFGVTSALAEPATVFIAKGDDTFCYVTWVTADLDLVFVPGRLQTGVDTNNDRGNAMLQCKLDFDWSQPVMVIDPVTGLVESVWLATIEQVCAAFGFTPCQRGNGPVIFRYANTGSFCYDERYGFSRNWQTVINQAGNANFVCKWPDREPN